MDLTIKDLQKVYEKLITASPKWFDLGLALGLSDHDLININIKNREDNDPCLRNMLAELLRTQRVTWGLLSDGLKANTVKLINLAETVADCAGEKVSVTPVVSVCEGEPAATSQRDYKEEVRPGITGEALASVCELPQNVSKEKLEQKSYDMEKKFNLLVIRLRKSLKEQKRDAVEITDCLLAINCMKQVYGGENQCMFRKKRRQLEECSTIDEIWRILRDYFSFFNFDIIELIASELRTKDDQGHMDKYKEDFRDYLKCRVFPLNILHSISPRDDSKELVLKLDCSFDDCDLAHLEGLRLRVAEILNLEPHIIHLYEIKRGCIQLVFVIPEFVFISPLTADDKCKLQQLKVTRLDCGTFHFEFHETETRSLRNGSSTIFPPFVLSRSGSQRSFPIRRKGPDSYADLSTARTSTTFEEEYNLLLEYEFLSDKGQLGERHSISLDVISESTYVMDRFLKEPDDVPSGLLPAPEVDFMVDYKFMKIGLYNKYSELDIGMYDTLPPLIKDASSRLHSAVFNGEVTKVRLLVEVFKCSPHTVNKVGLTASHTAAVSGNLSLLEYFLEDRLVFAGIQSHTNLSLLHVAAYNGHQMLVKYLVKDHQMDPLLLDKWLNSPLHEACLNGDLETVKYLVNEIKESQPFYINQKTSNGLTFMHCAAISGIAKLMEYLLKASYESPLIVHIGDKYGMTALMIASYYGYEDIVELLTSTEFTPQDSEALNMKDNFGESVLLKACLQGQQKVVEVLVKSKCDVNTQNMNGETALIVAAQNGDLGIVEILIDADASVNQQRNDGSSALYIAAQNGHIRIVEALIAANTNVNLENKAKSTALHRAANNGHDEIVRVLLDAGARVNVKSESATTPLMSAAINGHANIVEQLLLKGADRSIQNKYPKGFNTAYDLAVIRGHVKVCEVLRRYP